MTPPAVQDLVEEELIHYEIGVTVQKEVDTVRARIQRRFDELGQPDQSYLNEVPVVQKQEPKDAQCNNVPDILDDVQTQREESKGDQPSGVELQVAVGSSIKEKIRQIKLLQAQQQLAEEKSLQRVLPSTSAPPQSVSPSPEKKTKKKKDKKDKKKKKSK